VAAHIHAVERPDPKESPATGKFVQVAEATEQVHAAAAVAHAEAAAYAHP
jgi:hypothetical protein